MTPPTAGGPWIGGTGYTRVGASRGPGGPEAGPWPAAEEHRGVGPPLTPTHSRALDIKDPPCRA